MNMQGTSRQGEKGTAAGQQTGQQMEHHNYPNPDQQTRAGNQQTGLGNQKTQMGDGKSEKMGDRGMSQLQMHSEGQIARTIEQQTAKLPSDIFLWAAIGGMGVSAILELTGYKDKSRFFGQWVAPFLLFGLYNKLVKVAGSDRMHSGSSRIH